MVIEEIKTEHVRWFPCWRIIPSRFPPIGLFERVTSLEEFDAIYEIEQFTNPRIRNEIGEIQLVPKTERIYGPGTGYIMAAFTHLSRSSRFSDGSYGVYYAGDSLETAMAETKYHREKFLKTFKSPRIEIDMRVILSDVKADLHTLLGLQSTLPDIYHPDDYSASQKLGKKLRAEGISSFGIHYNSVRFAEGKCIAIFRPKVLSPCRQERHLCYVWNGDKISKIYRKELSI